MPDCGSVSQRVPSLHLTVAQLEMHRASPFCIRRRMARAGAHCQNGTDMRRPQSKIAGAMRWCGCLNTHPAGAAGLTSTWQKLPTRQVVKAQGLVAAAGTHWGLPFCGWQRVGGQQCTSDGQSEAKGSSMLQQQHMRVHVLRRKSTSQLQCSANAAAKTAREPHVQTAAALTSSGWHSRPSLQRALAHTLMHWALPSCTQ